MVFDPPTPQPPPNTIRPLHSAMLFMWYFLTLPVLSTQITKTLFKKRGWHRKQSLPKYLLRRYVHSLCLSLWPRSGLLQHSLTACTAEWPDTAVPLARDGILVLTRGDRAWGQEGSLFVCVVFVFCFSNKIQISVFII